MGAEAWIVRGPWRESIGEALAETREAVFREGVYAPVPGRRFATLAALDAFFMGEPEVDDDGEVNLDGASGTSSILDIRGVGEAPEPGLTAPVTEARMREVFGTATPSVAEVTLDRCEALLRELTRGASQYVVAHEGGAPAAVVFFGYSWD